VDFSLVEVSMCFLLTALLNLVWSCLLRIEKDGIVFGIVLEVKADKLDLSAFFFFFFMNLYLLNENITNGFHSVALNLVTITAILCGIFVIVSKNPVVSVLFLIGLFMSISIYLMMLGINFIGLSYLLVYVGAVSILFLFILMLINIRISEIISSTSNSIPLAIIIGSLFFSTVYQALPRGLEIASYNEDNTVPAFSLFKDEIKKYFFHFNDFLVNAAGQSITNSSKDIQGGIASSLQSRNQSLEFVSSQA
jgi:NADH-ubiquinone oxidoreductase chain 6